MENLSFFNETFSINNTSTYLLSLELEYAGYAYSIIDSIRNRYVAIKYVNFEKDILSNDYADKLKFMIDTDPFLKRNYKTVNFSFVTHKTTLIPKSLFEKKDIKLYFEFNQKLDEFEELHFNYLQNTEAYNIFAIPSEVTTILVNRFPEIRFFHQASMFIENTLNKAKNLKFKLPYIQINVNSEFFDIAVVVNEKVVLYNTYFFTGEADFVYYILNTLNQLGLKSTKGYLDICGEVSQDSKIFKQAQNYFPALKFSKLITGTEYVFYDVPEHTLYNVLNLHKCE
jgi:hypothetical protein